MWSGVRFSRMTSPGWSNRTSTIARSEGDSRTSSMNSSRSTRPLSPPTSFIRAPLIAEVEDSRVGRVDEVQADDLADLGLGPVVGLAVGQHHVAEAAHRREGRPGALERRDLAVLDQDVVERDRQLTVHRRPVVGVGGLDDDPGIQAHLLGEVLADVRVVPVKAGVGELQPIGELAAVRDRRLGLLGDAVEAVLEPQAVPVQRRVDVAEVGRLDRRPRCPGRHAASGPGIEPL